jgi:hypothetical protein
MKKSLAFLILLSMFALVVQSAFSDTLGGQAANGQMEDWAGTQGPYVTMNIGVEIVGLGQAAQQAAEGLNLIGQALHELASDPDLSIAHQEKIDQTLSRVDKLGHSLALALEQFPDTVEKSMRPVVYATNELSSQIKRIVIMTAVALILIIFAAMAAVYHFVLAPGTRSVVKTAKLLDELAKTLKTTAQIVEVSSERNLQVMEQLQNVQQQSMAASNRL